MISMQRPLRRRPIRSVSVLLTIALAAAIPQVVLAAPTHVESPAGVTSDLHEGSTGPQVTHAQEALVDAGVFLPGGADGVYGSATTKAIRQFQAWNGLEHTGVLDASTSRRLGLSSNATGPSSGSSSSGSSSSTYSGLSLGSTGDAVTELQRALLDTGLVIHGGADGTFGVATRRAVMAFQRVNGMAETGIVSERAARLLGLGNPTSAAAVQQRSDRSTGSGTAEGSGSSGTTTGGSNSSGGSVTLRRFPVQGYCGFGDTWHAPRGGGRLHEGVDIIAPVGNLIYAVADGTITTQYWDYPGRLSGNGVKLTMADGTYFVYLHMSGFAQGLGKGTQVKTGDVLGFIGNTGSSATPHLHFEIHPGGGGAVNPYPYVKAIDDCSNTGAQYQSSFT